MIYEQPLLCCVIKTTKLLGTFDEAKHVLFSTVVSVSVFFVARGTFNPGSVQASGAERNSSRWRGCPTALDYEGFVFSKYIQLGTVHHSIACKGGIC